MGMYSHSAAWDVFGGNPSKTLQLHSPMLTVLAYSLTELNLQGLQLAVRTCVG